MEESRSQDAGKLTQQQLDRIQAKRARDCFHASIHFMKQTHESQDIINMLELELIDLI